MDSKGSQLFGCQLFVLALRTYAISIIWPCEQSRAPPAEFLEIESCLDVILVTEGVRSSGPVGRHLGIIFTSAGCQPDTYPEDAIEIFAGVRTQIPFP